MSTRKKRIALLTEHRQKALNDRVVELGERRQAQADAEAAELQAALRCERTISERTQAAQRGVESNDWQQLNTWLEALQVAHLHAQSATQRAIAATAQAQQNVLAARSAVKQIETLTERLRQRELLDERRREQRAADEHSQSLSARRQEAS